MNSSLRLAAAAFGVLAISSAARAQCLAWADEFRSGGLPGLVAAQVVFDDGLGGGEQLYATSEASSTTTSLFDSIYRWDGARWTALPSRLTPSASFVSARVNALAVFDDGSGDALYAAGKFIAVDGVAASNLARWNGVSWSPVAGGTNSDVYGLTVFDDGAGAALYAAGLFTAAGGVTVHRIAKWSGSNWSALGTSMQSGASGVASVNVLLVHDDGSGPALFAGGRFNLVDGISMRNVAKWNGSSWSALGPGLPPDVKSLCAYDDGSGSVLYAGGLFNSVNNQPGGGHIAKWQAGTWSPVGGGVETSVLALQVFDDGSGPQLYVGGTVNATGASSVLGYGLARWNGNIWSAPTSGSGLRCATCPDGAIVNSLALFDDGSGPGLFAGGLFEVADASPAHNVARLTASGWSVLETGNAPSGRVFALQVHDDGGGQALYVGGKFLHAAATVADSIVRFDGTTWSTVGSGAQCNGVVYAFAEFDDGSGTALFVGGSFTTIDGVAADHIAKWNGASWSEVGGSIDTSSATYVNNLAVYDDGTGAALFVSGVFSSVGGVTARNIAKWNGTSWSALAAGTSYPPSSMVAFDDGSGPALYVGIEFGGALGTNAYGIARWDGSSWTTVGNVGLWNPSGARDLIVHDDGSGPALYAVGSFTIAGNTSVSRVARWNGSIWSDVGGGITSPAVTLGVFDDGSGPALYAAGFSSATAGGVPVQGIARWDGVHWSALEAGVIGSGVALVGSPQPLASIDALAVFDDGRGTGPALFAGGPIVKAGDHFSANFAKWAHSCPCPPENYCTAKVNSQGCTPSIFSIGTTSIAANNLRVKASNVLNNKSGVLFWGVAPKSSPFQGGTLCVEAPTIRTPVQDSGGNTPPDDCSGVYSFHFNANYIATQGLVPGDGVYCQYWSRDPASPSTTGLTDGLVFFVCP